jgi:hypothetical protein
VWDPFLIFCDDFFCWLVLRLKINAITIDGWCWLLVFPRDSFNPLMGLIQDAAVQWDSLSTFFPAPFFLLLGMHTMASHAVFCDTIYSTPA